MNVGCIRVSTDTQDVANQRLEILEHARRANMRVDEFLEIEASSRKTKAERRIEELLGLVKVGDTIVVSELSRLGRSTAEVINLVNHLIERGVGLIAIKQGLNIAGTMDMTTKIMVTMFALFGELERDMISRRTKEALAAKRLNGARLGRPTGSLGSSKLDPFRAEIVQMLRDRAPKTYIARRLKVGRTTLIEYIRTRGLEKQGRRAPSLSSS